MDRHKSTPVAIFGSEYHVRADADSDYVHSIAAYVDSKMNEIAKTQNLVSSTKVAILAAINIADELFKERRAFRETERHVSEKICQLSESLAKEL